MRRTFHSLVAWASSPCAGLERTEATGSSSAPRPGIWRDPVSAQPSKDFGVLTRGMGWKPMLQAFALLAPPAQFTTELIGRCQRQRSAVARLPQRRRTLRRKTKTITVIFSMLFSGTAGASEIEFGWEGRQILAVLEVADPAHGIDATEARALAEAYFRMTEGFDGGLWSIQREGNWWRFETVVGPQGVEGQDILIHTENGLIAKAGSESVPFPWEELRSWFSDMLRTVAGAIAEQDGIDKAAAASDSEPPNEKTPASESKSLPR